MFKLLRRMPFLRVLAIGQTVLLARRHYHRLAPADRHRLAELVRHSRHLTPAERTELRAILAKLGPREFAVAAANRFSPVRLPRWFGGRSAR